MKRRGAAAALALLCLSGCGARVTIPEYEIPSVEQTPRTAAPSLRYDQDLVWYGSAGLMDAPTILYSVYLNGPDGAVWTEDAIAQSRQSLDVAVNWLAEQAAVWGAEHHVLYYGEDLSATMTVSHRFNGEDEGDSFYDQLDEFCARLDTDELRGTYGTDSIGFLFFLPAAGASYTMPHYVDDGMWYTYEYCLLYQEDIYSEEGTAESPAVYAHEILHLFGAPDLYEGSSDYYITGEAVEYAVTLWPDAIMYDTYNQAGGIDYDHIDKEICPLTAFRLGLCDSFEGMDRFPAVAELPAGVFGSDGSAMDGLPVTEAV